MTFVELVDRLRELAGVSGTVLTVAGVSGEYRRLVNWTASAWMDIQNLHSSWHFLREDLSFTTTVGQTDYTLAQMHAQYLKQLDVDTIRIEQTSVGMSDRQDMVSMDYRTFRDTYRFNVLQTGRPTNFAQNPKTRGVLLSHSPDVEYTITGEYWRSPILLTSNYDVPALPEEFHMLIPYWALSKYAGFESAPEAKQEAIENVSRILSSLENNQLPDIELAGG